jgi:hypothetical protein
MENQKVSLGEDKVGGPTEFRNGKLLLVLPLLIRRFSLHQCFAYRKLQQRRRSGTIFSDTMTIHEILLFYKDLMCPSCNCSMILSEDLLSSVII